MLSKMQKGLLWLFGAMFLIPEILWSPILTYILPFFLGGSYKFRDSFLFSGYYSPLIATVVIMIQLVGILLFSWIIYKNEKNLKYKYLVLGLLVLVSLINLAVLFLQIMLSRSDLLGL